jgi:hypothetical protein
MFAFVFFLFLFSYSLISLFSEGFLILICCGAAIFGRISLSIGLIVIGFCGLSISFWSSGCLFCLLGLLIPSGGSLHSIPNYRLCSATISWIATPSSKTNFPLQYSARSTV